MLLAPETVKSAPPVSRVNSVIGYTPWLPDKRGSALGPSGFYYQRDDRFGSILLKKELVVIGES
jgi:hypothetical protein